MSLLQKRERSYISHEVYLSLPQLDLSDIILAEPLAVGKRKRSRMIGARVEAEVARIQEQQSNPSRQVISDLSKGRPTSSFRGLNFQKDNNKAAIPTSSQALAAGNKGIV